MERNSILRGGVEIEKEKDRVLKGENGGHPFGYGAGVKEKD